MMLDRKDLWPQTGERDDDPAVAPSGRTLRTADELVGKSLIEPRHRAMVAQIGARYALAITPEMAALIAVGRNDDPIARQFVPDASELVTLPHERVDPIGDHAHSPVPGIVHRYRDRVLLKVTHVCPIYCRFCFRREMVGPENGDILSSDQLAAALDYIDAHQEIWEVILTGGDPFVLSPRRIQDLTQKLGRIAHVKTLRWHTRVPVVDPARVTSLMISSLKASSLPVVVAIHANHPREFTPSAQRAIGMLADAGVSLLSQTVLLRGINDDADTLETLMRGFVENRVKPYYLHHADLAPGTAHLRTEIARGRAIMSELAGRLSGIALPRYVLDIPGGHGKVEIASHVCDLGDGRYRVRDHKGGEHIYADTLEPVQDAPSSSTGDERETSARALP